MDTQLYESQIPDTYLCNYFEIHIASKRRIDDYATLGKQYHNLCKLCAELWDRPSDGIWIQISKDANAFNRNFKVKMITPITWRYNYLKTISDLRILRIVFEAVKFKKYHGTFPRSQEQFFPRDIPQSNLISFDYAGTKDTFKVTSSVKNSSFEYQKKKLKTEVLKNKDHTVSPFGI